MVFVAAEQRELEGLLAHVSEITKPDWPLDFARLGSLHGTRVAMVANGPGPALAGIAVDVVKERVNRTGEKLSHLVSIGFCGGLQSWLGPCDIFVATYVNNNTSSLLPATQKSFKSGKLVSINRVASTTGEKAELARTGADAVEMEAAAVGARAKQWNVPFYAVRVVTDTSTEEFAVDFNQMRSRDGRFSRTKILTAALGNPTKVIPELIKLNQRTKRAAQALGDFLADARF